MRPWIAIKSAPALCTARAIFSISTAPKPSRTFALVNFLFEYFLIVSTRRDRRGRSSSSAEPAPCFTTLGTGQPQFRSMPSMPSNLLMSKTAFLIISASLPAICTKNGVSAAFFSSIFSVFSPSKTRAFALIISLTVASQPNFFTTPRSGGSEKPAKGAKNKGSLLKKSFVILNFSF